MSTQTLPVSSVEELSTGRSAGSPRLAGKAAGQSAINSVGNGIKAGVQFVGQVAADILAYKPTVSESFPIEVRPGKDKYDTSAPWENSLEIWKGKKASSNGAAEAELAIYCVDCHLTGVVKLQGAAEFNIKDGLKVLYAQTDGDFTAQVALGIKASAKYEQDYEKEVLTYPIPGAGFVVKGIITIGAFVEARAKAHVEVELAGDLLAGIKMIECKLNAKIDFVKIENSQRPTLSPKFEPFFKANAQVSAKAGVSFPVAVGVGIKVPLLKFDGTVSIVEQPGINAEAEWKGSIGQGPSEGTDDGKKEGTNDGTKEGANDGTTESDLTSNTPVPEARSLFMREEEECKGIKWGVKFVNEIYLDAFKRYKHSLHKFEAPIAGSCFVPGSSSTTDSSGGTAIQKIAARAQGQVTDDWDAKEFDFVNDFADDWDAQDYADNDRMEAEALQEAEKSEQSGEYPDGTEFITIKDASQKFQLVSDDKGLLRPASSTNPLAAGNMFAEDEGLVYGDYTGRFFRHTSAIMRFTGVADISLGKKDAEPSDADFITFVPTRIAAGKYAYVAMTMDGKAYAVMTCNYQNAPSRVWLMKSQTWGEKILKIAPAFLTGGKITKCVNLLWSVDGSDVESW